MDLLLLQDTLSQGSASGATGFDDKFFTVESFMTFAGATTITFAVANGIQTAFNYNPKWLALIIAILVCEIGAYISKDNTLIPYLIALFNGFLVFTTAGGITALPGRGNPDTMDGNLASINPTKTLPKREFLSSWF